MKAGDPSLILLLGVVVVIAAIALSVVAAQIAHRMGLPALLGQSSAMAARRLGLIIPSWPGHDLRVAGEGLRTSGVRARPVCSASRAIS